LSKAQFVTSRVGLEFSDYVKTAIDTKQLD
jgi:hypothetical protein